MGVEKEVDRNKLSDYLPYLAFDEEHQAFINKDGTTGYLFECSPLYFLGEKTIGTLTSILKQDYGKGAVLQFILFGDTNISEHCEMIKSVDIRKTDLTKKINDYHAKFLRNSENYKQKIKGNKLKNYRLFVALKIEKPIDEMTILAFKETLLGAGLNPRNVDAGKLLSLVRQLLNGSQHNQTHYDDLKPISPQAIFADTEIDFSEATPKINDELISVITPKEFPDQLNKQGLTSIQVNQLIGDYMGGLGDLNQITSRFLWSCNILLDKVTRELHIKSSMANLQRLGAKKKNNIADRISILADAVKDMNNGHYLKFIPSLLIFADDKKELSTTTSRAIRLWESQGFLMQKENKIKTIMFLASLPFGLYAGKKQRNIDFIDRHFIARSESIAAQLPLQGDYTGSGYPVVPFVGRKGQVQGIDLYSKQANNHNFLCCATSGSGKSFFVNYLLSSYFGAGAKIRINDIGGSYKKICSVLGGMYIDISDKSVNLNPFQVSNDLNKDYTEADLNNYDEIDKEHDIETIAMILGEMLYSNADDGKSTITAEEVGLLIHAVKHVIADGVVKNSIDAVQEYLSNIEMYSKDGSVPASLHRRAKELSFNLCPFSTTGDYGDLFNGVSENKWQDNPFVVLELESLSAKPALMKVVSLQIINMMTQEMYQGDRSEKKISIFDEVAFMFGSSQRLAKVVEDGYRRARKYNGSFGTIFQSILDTQLFGRVGEVMNNNAAWKFYLESKDYQKAIDKGIISMDSFSANLLNSIRSNRPHYSEIFMETPSGCGISRLMVGPYGHAVATTDADEVSEIEKYQKEGLSVADALEKFAVARGLRID